MHRGSPRPLCADAFSLTCFCTQGLLSRHVFDHHYPPHHPRYYPHPDHLDHLYHHLHHHLHQILFHHYFLSLMNRKKSNLYLAFVCICSFSPTSQWSSGDQVVALLPRMFLTGSAVWPWRLERRSPLRNLKVERLGETFGFQGFQLEDDSGMLYNMCKGCWKVWHQRYKPIWHADACFIKIHAPGVGRSSFGFEESNPQFPVAPFH